VENKIHNGFAIGKYVAQELPKGKV